MDVQTIDAMPAGQDLDALVAERITGVPVSWVTTTGGHRVAPCLPRYSIDIAAAWPLVERFVMDVQCRRPWVAAENRWLVIAYPADTDYIGLDGTPYEGRYSPVGTNLINADQAEAMVRYMVEGIEEYDDARSALAFIALQPCEANCSERPGECITEACLSCYARAAVASPVRSPAPSRRADRDARPPQPWRTNA